MGCVWPVLGAIAACVFFSNGSMALGVLSVVAALWSSSSGNEMMRQRQEGFGRVDAINDTTAVVNFLVSVACLVLLIVALIIGSGGADPRDKQIRDAFKAAEQCKGTQRCADELNRAFKLYLEKTGKPNTLKSMHEMQMEYDPEYRKYVREHK